MIISTIDRNTWVLDQRNTSRSTHLSLDEQSFIHLGLDVYAKYTSDIY